MDLYVELMNVIDALEREGVEYALCGGVAVTIHGAPRFTNDIDLLIASSDVPAVLEAVRSVGFDIEALSMTFGAGTPGERRLQRVSKMDSGELLTLDLVLVTSVFEDVWADREVYDVEGRRAGVVSVAGLIKMKRLADRPQDRLDIERLQELLDAAAPED